MATSTLDLRQVREPIHVTALLDACHSLQRGEELTVKVPYSPTELTAAIERDYAQAVGWEVLDSGNNLWTIRLKKVAETAIPTLITATDEPPTAGPLWKLQAQARDHDASIIWIPPGEHIPAHRGPVFDVILVVLSGGGTLHTERGQLALRLGNVVYLPARSQRSFTAGEEGLKYVSTHTRLDAMKNKQ